MSEIITSYPTSELTDRSLNSLNTAFFDCISAIPEVAEFFDSVEKLGDDTTTTSTDFGIKLTKGSSFIRTQLFNSSGAIRFLNNSNSISSSTASGSYASNNTSAAATTDISVSHATGINGTTALWLDNYSIGTCMIFNQFEERFFLANSSGISSSSWFYSDTGGAVKNLAAPFNGSNIGTGGDVIAQPYYHLGINTGDIYTFDGGSATIPWGKFKLGNAGFVRLFSNFALRIK